MKILRKLSLHKALQRIFKPPLSQPWMDRIFSQRRQNFYLTPKQILKKYGFQFSQPTYNAKIIAILILATFFGILMNSYVHQIYTNELRTIYPYRFIEMEHSSVRLRFKMFLTYMTDFLNKNIFVTQYYHQKNPSFNENKVIGPQTQAVFRYYQWKNYNKNKQRRFQFVDIGVMDKFPFPNIVQKQDQ